MKEFLKSAAIAITLTAIGELALKGVKKLKKKRKIKELEEETSALEYEFKYGTENRARLLELIQNQEDEVCDNMEWCPKKHQLLGRLIDIRLKLQEQLKEGV